MNNSLFSSNINHEQGFLFNVDIMIHSRSNAYALQALLEILNAQDGISDFRIQSGIELGAIIKQALQQNSSPETDKYPTTPQQSGYIHPEPMKHRSYSNTVNQAVRGQVSPLHPEQSIPASTSPTDDWINSAMQAGRLIRIDIRDKKGLQKSIPCRILNYDRGTNLVSVYHVDEKQVYSIHTSEIEKYV
ncbi:hypothetical protein [Paenibacillus sp. Marseille-Q4541]|uniref:hypothetical protein n=1 Tax=Paenibacillus sp. Marseille-Q4541 TaxID=2831522 RepID=UPI001BA7680E|nr:hypothetical protein [Paenibacillus sp. Marseille-Q4541]